MIPSNQLKLFIARKCKVDMSDNTTLVNVLDEILKVAREIERLTRNTTVASWITCTFQSVLSQDQIAFSFGFICHGVLIHSSARQNRWKFIKATIAKKKLGNISFEDRQAGFVGLCAAYVHTLTFYVNNVMCILSYWAFWSRQCSCITNPNRYHTAIDTRSHPGWNNTHSHVCLFRDIFLYSFNDPSRHIREPLPGQHSTFSFAINCHFDLMAWA